MFRAFFQFPMATGFQTRKYLKLPATLRIARQFQFLCWNRNRFALKYFSTIRQLAVLFKLVLYLLDKKALRFKLRRVNAAITTLTWTLNFHVRN
jgi:hypothetical protein